MSTLLPPGAPLQPTGRSPHAAYAANATNATHAANTSPTPPRRPSSAATNAQDFAHALARIRESAQESSDRTDPAAHANARRGPSQGAPANDTQATESARDEDKDASEARAAQAPTGWLEALGLTGRAARGEAAGLLSTRDDFGPGGSASDPLAGLRAGGDSALGADAAADAHASTSLAAQAAHPNQAIEPGQDIDLLQADTARDAGTLRNAQRADVPGLAQALPSGRHGDPGVLARDTAAAGLATPAAGAADTGTAAIESAIASATAQSTDFSARLNAASPAGEPLPSPGAAVLHGQLEPEVGSAQWQQALHQQLLQMRQADARQAELQLNPAGLGPLRIALTMHEQQLHAHFTAAHAQVRAALEAALPQLREALQQGGIQLGQAAVDTGSQPQAGLADPSGSQRRDPDARASRHPSAHLPSAADTASAGPAPAGTTRHGPGQRLNTYA